MSDTVTSRGVTHAVVTPRHAADLHTIAMSAVRLLPDDWQVKCVPGTAIPSDDPANWHSFHSGSEPDGELVVSVPCPDTPSALFIFLHEIGHVMLGHLYLTNSDTPPIIVEQIELSASLWAYNYMLSHDMEVPLVSKVMAKVMARAQRLQVLLAEAGMPTH